MFKFIKGETRSDNECLIIWLNNIPITHGQQASTFGVTPTHGGFCNINKDALNYNFFTVYGSAPSIDCDSKGLDYGRLASFIREGHIEFCEETGVSIVTPKSFTTLSKRFSVFRAQKNEPVTLEEMVEKYEQIFKKLYPNLS